MFIKLIRLQNMAPTQTNCMNIKESVGDRYFY